jgi:branched-chain amino acid transport system permease protein
MSLDFVNLANIVISGLLTGIVYGLMALGLSVIFGVARVVNFAHGEMMALAMYLSVLLFSTLHLEPFLSVAPVAVVFFIFGYVLYGAVIHPFVTRPEHSQFILLLAVGIIIRQGDPRLRRQLSAPRSSASNVKRLYALTFGLGSACVAVAGCAMVLLVDVTPPLGPAYTLLAFVIVIVGGLGSMTGALLGGVLIGVSEALAGLFITPSAKSMFSFGLLIWCCCCARRACWERR